MPTAEVRAEIFGPGGVADEQRQSDVAARLVEKAIDQTDLLFLTELVLPQIIEVAFLQDAARGEMSAGQGVSNAEAKEVVLKTGGLADVARVAVSGAMLEMKVHIRVAGARLLRDPESVEALRFGERMREVLVDPFEVGDDGAAERRDAVEDEEIVVPARGELVVEEDIDSIRLVRSPGHLAGQAVRRRRSGGHDVRFFRPEPAVEDHVRACGARLSEQSAIERSLFRTAPDEPPVRLAAADHTRHARGVVERGPIGGAKVEVLLHADPFEEARNRLAHGRGFDDLQIADEARADITLRFVYLDLASGVRQSDGRREPGRPRASDADRAVILHSRGMLSRRVYFEFRD